MNNIRCIIIDDEPLAIQLLADYVEKTGGLTLIATFSNPIEGLQYLQQHDVDLIFLDIQMPELTGVQLMKILNQKFPIILTTAYSQYAIDGFEHNVIDYLLKPIPYDRFLVAIQKVQSNMNEAIQVTSAPTYIFVKSEYRVQKILLQDILYLEGLGDYVAIHTKEGKILTLEKMKHFAQLLPDNDFMRVHKSYIVALNKIEYIERNRIVIKAVRLPISDTYKKAFWAKVKG